MAQQSHFSVKETMPPAIEPVSVAYAKQWLRIDSSDLDLQLADLIVMARQLCTDYAGRAFINTGYTMNMDRVPLVPNSQYTPGVPSLLTPVLQNTWPLDPSIWAIKIPRAPLVSVNSFTYIQNEQALTLDPSQYLVDLTSEPGRLSPVSGGFWPSVDWRPNSVSITFTAGYGTTQSSVPAKFRIAIVAAVGSWLDNPNGPADGLPEAVKSVLNADPVTEQW